MLVGVAVGYAMLVTGALGVMWFGTRLRPPDVNVIAFAVSVQLLELLPWLLGGAVAGYLEADSRLRGGVNGWASGLVAGFVLGFVGWFLIVAGVRVEPAPTYGFADTSGSSSRRSLQGSASASCWASWDHRRSARLRGPAADAVTNLKYPD